MIRRVAWIVGGLAAFALGGWGITIPVSDARSTGFDSSGNLLTSDAAADGNWTFYSGNSLSALSGAPIGAWVVRTTGKPFQNPTTWTPNTASSQWISPTFARTGNGKHLAVVSGTSYIAVTSFTIPAMTNPPNLSQWWLVMSGIVWADDSVLNNNYYLLAADNSLVYTGTLTGTASGTSSASFAFQRWVDPSATYKLAFILPNTADTFAGFRLQFNEAYVTPEPGAWALMLSAGAGLAFASRRRRGAKKPQA